MGTIFEITKNLNKNHRTVIKEIENIGKIKLEKI